MKKKRTWTYNLALSILSLYLMMSLLSPWMAQSYPILYIKKGQWQQNFFKSSDQEFKNIDLYILPLIPFGPQQTNLKEAHLPPLTISPSLPEKKHWLGTDKLGRDILSGIIHGASISLKIGFISVILAMLLGIPIGVCASYYGNKGIRFNIYQWIFFIVSVGLVIFYLYFEWAHWNFLQVIMYLIGSTLLLIFINYFLRRINTKIRIPFPMDTLVIKTAELRKSFPGLFILLALTTLFEKTSIYNIVFIIVLLSWIEFARYARAESLSVIHTPFIESSKLLGFKDGYIIWRHIIPNIFPVLIVLGSYGVSNAILLESTLSFLGLGLPTELVTWGKMISEGRNIQYPWMVFFPGLAIFLLILSLHKVADYHK